MFGDKPQLIPLLLIALILPFVTCSRISATSCFFLFFFRAGIFFHHGPSPTYLPIPRFTQSRPAIKICNPPFLNSLYICVFFKGQSCKKGHACVFLVFCLEDKTKRVNLTLHCTYFHILQMFIDIKFIRRTSVLIWMEDSEVSVDLLEIQLVGARRHANEGMGREKSLSDLIVKLRGQAPKVLQDPPATNPTPLRFLRTITTFSHRVAEGWLYFFASSPHLQL